MLKRLSIQSKLMLMLLLVSLSSSSAIAYQGYQSGRKALEASIFKQLTSLRALRSGQIETYLEGLRAELQTLSQNPLTLNAMVAFDRTFNQLNKTEIPRAWDFKTEAYYETVFLPRLRNNVEGNPQLDIYRPFRKPNRYLQYHYIAQNPNPPEQKHLLKDAADGSEYSKIHLQYHPVFSALSEQFSFDDIFLIDPRGNVVYSTFKAIDFGSNLQEGPLSESGLTMVFQLAIKREKGGVVLSDFSAYRAAYGAPAAFLASPLYHDAKLVGVVAVRLPIAKLNQLMTSKGEWEREGLGRTGETYLVGDDYLMRSQSRFLLESPAKYFAALAQRGVDAEELARIQQLNTTILTQSAKSPTIDEALKGNSGTIIHRSYRDTQVLTAYGPLQLNGLNWAMVADIETTEAFAPIAEFERTILMTTAALMLGVTLIALALARQFLRPISRLSQGFEEIQRGKTTVEIPVDSQDEFGHLTQAFNKTVKSLHHKNQIVKQKEAENHALLKSIVPEEVAERMRQGEKNIADTYSNVTVLFASLEGFSQLFNDQSAEQVIGLLNEIVTGFDEAAAQLGIEKIKTLGSGYLAVCGLAVPRLDGANRMVDFAQEMMRRTRAFNHTHGLNLKIQIGISRGEVVAGVVGSGQFIYDIWGTTVNQAHRIHSLRSNAIQVTEPVYQRVSSTYDFKPVTDFPEANALLSQGCEVWSLGSRVPASIES